MKNRSWWTILVPVLIFVFCRPIVLEANAGLFEIEAGASYEELDSGYDDWNSKYLEASFALGDRKVLYGGLRETYRFSLYDTEVMAGMYYPAHERVTLLVEGTDSPTHRVLPEWSLLGQAEVALSGGWSSALGFRTTQYTSSEVYQGTLTINKYWSSYLTSYTFYATRVEDAGDAGSHRLQLFYFYGVNSRVAAGYAIGREVENIGDGEVLVSDIQTITLGGRHWFSPAWAASWELSEHRQGDQYTRRGGRVGLRYAY